MDRFFKNLALFNHCFSSVMPRCWCGKRSNSQKESKQSTTS